MEPAYSGRLGGYLTTVTVQVIGKDEPSSGTSISGKLCRTSVVRGASVDALLGLAQKIARAHGFHPEMARKLGGLAVGRVLTLDSYLQVLQDRDSCNERFREMLEVPALMIDTQLRMRRAYAGGKIAAQVFEHGEKVRRSRSGHYLGSFEILLKGGVYSLEQECTEAELTYIPAGEQTKQVLKVSNLFPGGFFERRRIPIAIQHIGARAEVSIDGSKTLNTAVDQYFPNVRHITVPILVTGCYRDRTTPPSPPPGSSLF